MKMASTDSSESGNCLSKLMACFTNKDQGKENKSAPVAVVNSLTNMDKGKENKSAPVAVFKGNSRGGEKRRQRPKVIIHHPPWKVPTINDPFPNLEGQTQCNPEFNLYDYKGSSWAMIFTHPTDFTPVCTSEFVELLKLKQELQANDVKLVGFSTNVADTSRNWLMDVEAIANGYDVENSANGTESVTTAASKFSDCPESEIKLDFPIYSDPTLDMAIELGIIADGDAQDEECPVTARSIYIVTPDNKIALITTYPSTVGRNWKEALRCILALQVVEKSKGCVSIPSHWEAGEKVLIDAKLTDSKCDTYFGKENWERIYLPSEVCQEVGSFAADTGGVCIDPNNQETVVTLPRHYMRYTHTTSESNKKCGVRVKGLKSITSGHLLEEDKVTLDNL